MSLKRKGDDVFTDVSFGQGNNQQQGQQLSSGYSQQKAEVVVVPVEATEKTTATPLVSLSDADDNDENNPPVASMKRITLQLQSLRTESLQSEDPLLDQIMQIKNRYATAETTKFPLSDEDKKNHLPVGSEEESSLADAYDDDAIEQLLKESKSVRSQLSEKLQMAREECSQESERLSSVSSQLAAMKEQRAALAQQMLDLERRQVELQTQISLHQEEATEEIESIDTVEEERKRQVPRLKTQLSLYAATTGIKWDFDESTSNQTVTANETTTNDDHDDDGKEPSCTILSGQVAVPSQESVKLFSIDTSDKSQFEVANHLWQLMEGSSPHCP